jgi:hypothetical protein
LSACGADNFYRLLGVHAGSHEQGGCNQSRTANSLAAITEAQIYEYIQFLRASSEIITADRTLNLPMRDSRDVVVLQAAITGEAEIVGTFDSDFYDPETLAVCATWGTAVCTDVDRIGKLCATSSHRLKPMLLNLCFFARRDEFEVASLPNARLCSKTNPRTG